MTLVGPWYNGKTPRLQRGDASSILAGSTKVIGTTRSWEFDSPRVHFQNFYLIFLGKNLKMAWGESHRIATSQQVLKP